MTPARWVRRSVLAPAVLILTLLVLTSLPLVAVAAAFASRWLPGRWRALRLLWFVLVWSVVESLTLLGLVALWVGAGVGRRLAAEPWRARHYSLARWYVGVLVRCAERRFDLRFDIDAEAVRSQSSPRGPLLVLARHAGPGDSLLVVHGLLQLGYRPRIVLKGDLRWAPVLDVLLHRIPSTFVVTGAPPGTTAAAIRDLASTMGTGDALVLFPEGRNFTPGRRTRSITKLEELGDHAAAEEARELRHVLAPRAGGTVAALDGAPDADVVFVAHTGLEDLSGLVDLWRGLPMDAAVSAEVWRVPAAEVPRVREARVAWLAWWWRRIDRWLLERGGERSVPDAIVADLDDGEA
jgi:1-acyl-sn-glycerol-3-phosphate acyltransferase